MKIWNVRQPISTGDYIQKVFGQKFPKKAILQPWRSVFGWTNVISNFRGWLKSVQIYMVQWMGWNFDVFPGLQKIPCYARVILRYTVYLTYTLLSRSYSYTYHWIFNSYFHYTVSKHILVQKWKSADSKKLIYRIVASTNTCYYSENQLFVQRSQ